MIERHPYGHFIPKKPHSMIIGSFPIGKFSDPRRKSEIRPHEMEFFFGGEKNLLWKLLGQCYGRNLHSREDVINLLEEKGIAIGDVILSCKRKNGRASDSDLYNIKWNHELINIIHQHKIKRLYFTSRKVQAWFIKLFGHQDLEQVLLVSPSAQSVRGLSRMPAYIEWKKTHPAERAIDFIYWFYRKVFK